MSRYVALKDVARMALSMFGITKTEWLQPLRGLPTIDICFCRECKYWHEGKCWNIKGLNKTDGVVKADDFCSYGKHKEDLKGSKGSLNSSEKPNTSEKRSSE